MVSVGFDVAVGVDRLYRRFRPYRGIILRVLAVIVGILAWDAYASSQPEYLFPTAAAIFEALVQQYHEYGLVAAFVGSMQTLAVGYFLAVVVGIVTGLLMGVDRTVETLLNPYVTALYVAPIAALVPLLIFIFGATNTTRIVIVFLFVVFEVTIDTYKGARATPQGAIDVAKSFGADSLFVIRKVVIPNDLPYIFTGLRLGIGRGIKGLILAELLVEFANLGAVLRLWEHSFRLQGVLSIALLLMVLGIVLTKSMQRVERLLFTWETG